jgi:predicted acylesterase/phospholipase RssA
MVAIPAEADLGGYHTLAPDPGEGVFEIGLVLAGAVSAGAYTAGVIDFLVEALDAWEEAKTQRSKANPDPAQWDIPGHRVRLRVISGASAGAMTAVIAAVALRYQFPHVHLSVDGPSNPLYRPWVKDIDIAELLKTRDLAGNQDPLVSMLDSSVLLEILERALEYQGVPEKARPYLDPAIRVILTESNLRGIPYFLSMRGNLLEGLGMVAHADYQSFCVCYGANAGNGVRPDDVPVSFPNRAKDPSWYALGTAALASGAFPIGLAPRVVERPLTDFNYRFVALPGDGPEHPPQVVRLRPQWSASSQAPGPYRTVVVDGGTMNNEPLELARIELAGLLGRNPRDGLRANRATIMVDPFPDVAGTVDQPDRGQKLDLFSAVMGLMGAWKDQARFDPVDLALAADENTFSRFLIAPDRGASPVSNGYALACGALAGFSGFLAEAYRHHDYMLGRRNCQQFLRTHFCLPVDNNPVFKGVNPRLKAGSAWVVSDGGTPCLPIIPLVGNLAVEEALPAWPARVFNPDSIRPAFAARLKAIVERALSTSVRIGFLGRQLAKTGLGTVQRAALARAIEEIKKELTMRALI